MIEALGHAERAPVRENEKAPTCTAAGSYEEVITCSRCREEVSRKTVEIAALGHTPGEAVKENEVAATCLSAGSYEEVVCCTVCGEELSRKTVEVAALGHNHKGKETQRVTCISSGEMTYTCTRCVDSYKETIAPLGHDWGEMQPGTAATCTEKGYSDHRVCSRCGIDDGNTIPAKGHAFIGNTCGICGYAFYSEGLDYKVNGDTVTIIGKGDCSDTTIYIPAVIGGKRVTEIGDSAFFICTSLTEVVIPESVTSIGAYAFYGCDELTEIDIPEGVTSIGDYAFQECTSLTEMTIPDTVTTIGQNAFRDCTSLATVDLPNGIQTIEQHIFEGCTALETITLPDTVNLIHVAAFQNSGLKSITLPASLLTIEGNAFLGCDDLTTVYYRGSEEQ